MVGLSGEVNGTNWQGVGGRTLALMEAAIDGDSLSVMDPQWSLF